MDFGAAIFFTDYSMGPVELGRALEERGFGSLWAPEHSHIPLSRRTPFPQGGDLPKKYYDVMDPFVTLAAAAAATKRLQVATGVCLVVQRDPIQTAKAVASLDQVSGGRFLFGIGAGWNAEEMADHGTEFKTRFQVMRERVEAMKAIWTKSKPEYRASSSSFPAHDDLAQAGAEAPPAGDRGRRLSRTARAGPSPLGTAGSRMRAGPPMATCSGCCPISASWPRRRAATPPPCRSRSSAWPEDPDLDEAVSRCGGGAGGLQPGPAAGADEVLPVLDRCAGLMRGVGA